LTEFTAFLRGTLADTPSADGRDVNGKNFVFSDNEAELDDLF
jgi:hypothetical protein